MAFQLSSVVPWGRNMEEYKAMFLLNEEDMKKMKELEENELQACCKNASCYSRRDEKIRRN